MGDKKEIPEILSVRDVAAALEEANRFLLERGMQICPYSGIHIEVDTKDRYRAQISLVALSRIRKTSLDKLSSGVSNGRG